LEKKGCRIRKNQDGKVLKRQKSIEMKKKRWKKKEEAGINKKAYTIKLLRIGKGGGLL
jgi:hypothetical protein